jgi:Domain of unknown function (DUF4037)
MTPEFIPGRELSRRFFTDVVRPIVDDAFPALRYAAALLGAGSEVMGYDTEMSTDHDWGPHIDLFLHDDTPTDLRTQITTVLSERLPGEYCAYPLRPAIAPDTSDEVAGARVCAEVRVLTLASFIQSYLSFDVAAPIEPADWLTFPSQKLRTIAVGPIWHDEIGLGVARGRFAQYPHDVWLYLLAAGWTRIGQEDHLMGRAGMVGDEIGSAIIGARLVRDLMRLCFLMEREFAPYAKWFGTAFGQLPCAAELSPSLRGALTAATWQERERFLVAAYESVAEMHNRLGITHPLPATVRGFFTRPFQVIAAGEFAAAIVAEISDASLRRLITRPLIGGIDQLSDSTDLLEKTDWRPILRDLYN